MLAYRRHVAWQIYQIIMLMAYPAPMRRSLPLLATALLASCVPSPPHLEGATPVRATQWSADPTSADARPIDGEFWQQFGSPVLIGLIDEARQANPSLAAVRARVVQARAQTRIARADLLPTISANVGLTQTQTNNTGAAEFAYSAGSAGLDIAYDLDLFGGARAGKRAAGARYQAVVFDETAAMLVVETDLARNYVAYNALVDRIALADRGLADAKDLLRIIGIRRREGVATDVDVGLQSVEVSKLAAQRLSLEQSRRTTLAAIAVLVGQEAPAFDLPTDTVDTLTTPAINPGQPGDLVVRRPDIRAAEARISAANGDVQQARAAFLPNLRLSASGLGQALTASGPFGATLTAGGSLISPIFEGGKLRGRYNQARGAQVESVALYRQALLQALQEGSNALAAVAISRDRVAMLATATGAARRTSLLTRRQLIDGAVDVSAVLDAERNQFQLEDALIQARQDQLTAAIDLYKALGGTPAAPAPQRAAQSGRYQPVAARFR
jgi:NodT family efflux transporter outer membrane factor (OMF) lipoprotein